MNTIKQALKQIQITEAISHDYLIVHPLIRGQLFNKDYLTLDEALAKKTAFVTEVSDHGSVPELLFCNRGDQAVFLLDGEELIGAKQNRILNITILAPAHKDTVIPVSCVEAGRWRHTSDGFSSAPRAQFSASRAKRSAYVSKDIVDFGMRRSDQGEVWNDISCKLSSLGSQSETEAVESAFVDHKSKLNSYVEKLEPVDHQFGAIFSIKDRVVGMELFDSQETCRALMPKVIRSYALDAIDPVYRDSIQASQLSPKLLLQQVCDAPTHKAKAVGEGNDLRFDDASGLAGGALFARDRIVHLVTFVMPEQEHKGSDRVYRRRTF